MAFGKKKNQIEELKTELEAREKELQNVRPYVEMAQSVRKKIEELLEFYKTADLSKLDIAQMAYEAVLEVEKEKARNQLAARYQKEHIELLASKILDLTEAEEGETISQKAKRIIETDPKVALELRESARKQLLAKYQSHNAELLETEQAEYVETELDRKLKQDRMDVQFALERELDITAAEHDGVTFAQEDTLNLQLSSTTKWGNESRGVKFKWLKDAKGRSGWVYTGEFGTSQQRKISSNQSSIPKNVFVTIGSMCPDLESGQDVFMAGKLIAGMALAVQYKMPRSASKKAVEAVFNGESYSPPSFDSYSDTYTRNDRFPIQLASVDFEIRPVTLQQKTP